VLTWLLYIFVLFLSEMATLQSLDFMPAHLIVRRLGGCDEEEVPMNSGPKAECDQNKGIGRLVNFETITTID
jgi:hypothetical protein